MSEYAPISPQHEPAKENAEIPIWQHNIGLHCRLLLAGPALNPENINLPPVKIAPLGSLGSRSYDIFDQFAHDSRIKTYKESPDVTLAQTQWTENFVTKITSSSRFFSDTEDGKRWSGLFQALNIPIDALTAEQVDTFYNKYLQSDGKTGQLKQFVTDILNYHRNDKGDIQLDLLEENSDAINWIAHVFGDEAVVNTIRELIFAESRLIAEPNQFVRSANTPYQNNTALLRVNNLQASEISVLNPLWRFMQNQEKPITVAHFATPHHTDKVEQNTQEITPLEKPKAEFRREIKSLLERCGIEVDTVDPVPLGIGGNHTTYAYGDDKVVKLLNHQTKKGIEGAIAQTVRLSENRIEEDANIDTIVKAFPGFAIPTEVKNDPDSDRYVVVQQRVKGKSLTQLNCTPDLKNQLKEIITLNHRLMEKQNMSFDFVGHPGFLTWLSRQQKRRGPFEVSNIMIDEQGQLHIIDYDIFKFNDNSTIRQRITSKVGFFFNRLLMRHYFGVDIQPPKEKK